MSEKFRLGRKIGFQNTFYTKCINVIIDSIGPSIILRSICILTPDFTVKPVLSGHSKKKTNYRLMQVKSIVECSKGLLGEHSAILLTIIKLPFVIMIFVLSFLSGCLGHVLLN